MIKAVSTYIPACETADVIYSSKDRRESQTFNALDWLAQLVTHIPNKREQMMRYYGYYSNKARGMGLIMKDAVSVYAMPSYG
jgi:hypothetical protein